MNPTPHAKSSEPSGLAFSMEQLMEARSLSVLGSDLISQFHLPFDLPHAALNLYSILREGVDIDSPGVRTCERRYGSHVFSKCPTKNGCGPAALRSSGPQPAGSLHSSDGETASKSRTIGIICPKNVLTEERVSSCRKAISLSRC